jgi:hypothetical protein
VKAPEASYPAAHAALGDIEESILDLRYLPASAEWPETLDQTSYMSVVPQPWRAMAVFVEEVIVADARDRGIFDQERGLLDLEVIAMRSGGAASKLSLPDREPGPASNYSPLLNPCFLAVASIACFEGWGPDWPTPPFRNRKAPHDRSDRLRSVDLAARLGVGSRQLAVAARRLGINGPGSMRFASSIRRRGRDTAPVTTRGYTRTDFVRGLSWIVPLVGTA